jgi:hypothetical protein
MDEEKRLQIRKSIEECTRSSNVEYTLQNCKDGELPEIYRSVASILPYTQTQIAKLYKINSSNFSRWSKGNKRSPISSRVVRTLLLSICSGESPPTVLHTLQPLDRGSTIKTIDEMIELIGDIFPENERSNKSIIVVDRDNIGRYMKICCEDTIVINVAKKGTAYEIEDRSYLVYSSTMLKDAADISIVILLTKISIIYPEVKLMLYTNDHFCLEVTRCIKCEFINIYNDVPRKIE